MRSVAILAQPGAADKYTCPPDRQDVAPDVLRRLPPAANKVFWALVHLTGGVQATGERKAQVGLRELGQRAGITHTATARALRRLVAVRLVSWKVTGPGRGRRSVIVLNWTFRLNVNLEPENKTIRTAAKDTGGVTGGQTLRDVLREQRQLQLQASQGALRWAWGYLRGAVEGPADLRADLVAAAGVSLNRHLGAGVPLVAWNNTLRTLPGQLNNPPQGVLDTYRAGDRRRLYAWVSRLVRQLVRDAVGSVQARLQVLELTEQRLRWRPPEGPGLGELLRQVLRRKASKGAGAAPSGPGQGEATPGKGEQREKVASLSGDRFPLRVTHSVL